MQLVSSSPTEYECLFGISNARDTFAVGQIRFITPVLVHFGASLTKEPKYTLCGFCSPIQLQGQILLMLLSAWIFDVEQIHLHYFVDEFSLSARHPTFSSLARVLSLVRPFSKRTRSRPTH